MRVRAQHSRGNITAFSGKPFTSSQVSSKKAKFAQHHVNNRHLEDNQRRQSTPAAQTQDLQVQISVTQKMFEKMQKKNGNKTEAGGAGGQTTYTALKKADSVWRKVRQMKDQPDPQDIPPEFAIRTRGKLNRAPEYDVIMCGGTLGIFLACVLQQSGLRVAVVERGPLRGRDQEWNISRKELAELVAEGLVSKSEAEECITSEFNPVRAGFNGGIDVWTQNVLNLGVRPDKIMAKVRTRFESAGGKVFEFTAGKGIEVFDDGVALNVPDGQIRGCLLLDCMGNASPVVLQMRAGKKPDGVCLVVGSCCSGFEPDKNTTGDVIYTNTDIQAPDALVPDCQFFWEAFPAGSGKGDRTTYMFTYIDADPRRPDLEEMMEEYWRLMPTYQNVSLDQLQPLRILFGFFPTYRESPLKPQMDRILQIGDASGIQSPLSFGGFGALSRHLPRLKSAIVEAINTDRLDKESLAGVNAYNPGLSGAWMLQKAMSVRPGRQPQPAFINTLLSTNFKMMQQLGDPVLKPFLQDVIQFGPLAKTLGKQVVSDPGFVPQILLHVGLVPILDWTWHFINLGIYTVLYRTFSPLDEIISSQLNPLLKFGWKRTLEKWQYGSGADYTL